jgi:class III poly(R)-hydroxyalkanoic acid synthase PhaE subunit
MATYKSGDDWLKMSQNYWKGWQDLTQQAMQGIQSEHGAAPWHEGLEQWSRLFRGAAGSTDMNNALDQLLDHGRGYLNFLQQVAANPGGFGAEDLRSAAQRMVEELRAASPFAQAMPFGGSPLGEQLATALKWWQEAAQPIQEQAQGWSRMPAFGMAREYTEQAQALSAAQDRLKEANQRYGALIAKALEGGLERFQDKLAARFEPGARRVDDMRALYDLFIDGLEEAYAETALSAEFRVVYGDLVNAQSDLRLKIQRVVEQLTGALGVPTRSEINTLEARVHELRRAAKRTDDHPAIGSLKAEIDQLRKEMAALKASQHGASHDDDELPVAPRRAAAGRKPAVAAKPVTPARSATSSKASSADKGAPSKAKAASKADPAATKKTRSARSAATRTAKGK